MLGVTLMVEFLARNDLPVRVRPMQTDDVPYLLEIFGKMGAESRYNRFNETLVDPDEEMVWTEAEHIAEAIGRNSYGLLAFVDRPEIENTPIAGVRWVMVGPDTAEMAVSVTDEYQGLGIGTRLVELLVEEARAAGIRHLVGTVNSENSSMWAVLHKLPYPLSYVQDGATTAIKLDLEQSRPATR